MARTHNVAHSFDHQHSYRVQTVYLLYTLSADSMQYNVFSTNLHGQCA